MAHSIPTDDIVSCVQALVPPTVAVCGGPLDAVNDRLFEDELRALVDAVPHRQREFRAGRAYARRALRQIGVADEQLPVGHRRAPQWPPGTVGSISHTRSLCVAVAANAMHLAGIGIDIEDFSALAGDPLDLSSFVVTPGERARAFQSQGALSIDVARLLFVVKESIYKAYSPLAGGFLDYLDVGVDLDFTTQTFCPRHVGADRSASDIVNSMLGRFGISGHHILAVSMVPVRHSEIDSA